MFAIAFSAMVILALVSIVVHWTMRVRLMRLDSTKDRIEWLSFHGGDDVSVPSERAATFLPSRFLGGNRNRRCWTVRHCHSEGLRPVAGGELRLR
jgi:hypothetical protein